MSFTDPTGGRSTPAVSPDPAPAPAPVGGTEGDPAAPTDPAIEDPATGPTRDPGAPEPNGGVPPEPDPKPDPDPGGTDETSQPPKPPEPLEDPVRTAIRDEFQKVMDTIPRDPREFDFKVSTVKWFGILCAMALVLILAANAYFIDQLFETGRKHDPAIAFQPMMENAAGDRLFELAVENEALNMRNNRSVSALFMRAYTQFLSVTAGTILAMLGAIFVLARVDSRETRSEASWKEFRWLINTASPGVLLAGLGVVLVAFVAYRSITPIDTTDTPIFHSLGQGPVSSRLEGIMQSDEFKQQMRKDLEKLGTKP